MPIDERTVDAWRTASGHARRAASAFRAAGELCHDLAAACRMLRQRWREDHGQA